MILEPELRQRALTLAQVLDGESLLEEGFDPREVLNGKRRLTLQKADATRAADLIGERVEQVEPSLWPFGLDEETAALGGMGDE